MAAVAYAKPRVSYTTLVEFKNTVKPMKMKCVHNGYCLKRKSNYKHPRKGCSIIIY